MYTTVLKISTYQIKQNSWKMYTKVLKISTYQIEQNNQFMHENPAIVKRSVVAIYNL